MVGAIAIGYPAAGIPLPAWPAAAPRCWRRRRVANLAADPRAQELANPRGYTRRPDAEAEIRSLPEEAGRGFREAALGAKQGETLVFAVRALLRAGDMAGAEAVLE